MLEIALQETGPLRELLELVGMTPWLPGSCLSLCNLPSLKRHCPSAVPCCAAQCMLVALAPLLPFCGLLSLGKPTSPFLHVLAYAHSTVPCLVVRYSMPYNAKNLLEPDASRGGGRRTLQALASQLD